VKKYKKEFYYLLGIIFLYLLIYYEPEYEIEYIGRIIIKYIYI
jgi:hypothetical protein